jgi:hypothetical protein
MNKMKKVCHFGKNFLKDRNDSLHADFHIFEHSECVLEIIQFICIFWIKHGREKFFASVYSSVIEVRRH